MGRSGTHPQRSNRKRRCRRVQLCEGCRARNWSFVLDDTPPRLPMVAVGEVHPEHNGSAHGTRLPRIPERNVEWDILSTVFLTCYSGVLHNAAPLSTMRTWCLPTGSTTECRPRRWRGLIRWYVWICLVSSSNRE